MRQRNDGHEHSSREHSGHEHSGHEHSGHEHSIHELIADLGVSVEYSSDLPPGRLGAYLDDERRIIIRAGLTTPLERETLHHEYVHARYRDRASTPRAERRAERESAVMLVDEHRYAEAERSGLSALGIARHLDVPLAVVQVYQREILAGRIPDPRLRRLERPT